MSETRDQKQIDREIRERALLKSMTPGVTLEDLTFEEERELGMIDAGTPFHAKRLKEMRVEAFERRASQFQITDDLKSFVAIQSHQYGPKVRVWGNPMSWLAAFVVVRYGENLTHWPSRVNDAGEADPNGQRRFSDADNQRARNWAIRNEWPDGVTPIPVAQ